MFHRCLISLALVVSVALVVLSTGNIRADAGETQSVGPGHQSASLVGTVLREPPPRQLPVPVIGAPAGIDFSPYTHWLQSEMEDSGIPGAALAIVSSQGVIDLHTWGVRSLENGAPVEPETVFRIASVSKTFAGTVASQLVDRNVQSWDAPIINILPQYSIGTGAASRDITLRHIMSHSTGLMPHAFSNMLDAGVAYEAIQQKFNEIPTVCAPGRCYGYQNVVFSLIADIVQNSLDTTYEEYVHEHIFTPLGMQTASMTLEDFLASPNVSAPHQLARNGWRVSTVNPAYFTVGPASGINASIVDMVRWAQANLGGHPDVLSGSVLEMQYTPVVETPHGSYFNRWPRVERAWYGAGWRVFDYAGIRIVHHGGGVRGFRSEMVLIPELDLGLIVMFNAETRLANDVVPEFLDSLLAQVVYETSD